MNKLFYYSLALVLATGCSDSLPVKWATVDPSEILKNPPDGILVRKYVLTGKDNQNITGLLFEPDNGKDCPAILYLHWLGGSENVDRSALEFYSEAAEMARKGYICAVPDGYFPWTSAPRGDERDVAKLERQAGENHQVLELLRSLKKVDSASIALVGHDYGGMHALLTASREPGIDAVVVMTPVAEYYEWNRILTMVPEGEKLNDYREALSPYDPVTVAGKRAGIPLLYQFSDFDEYVSADNAQRLIAASGAGTEVLWYPVGHELNRHQPATVDRMNWLQAALRGRR